MREEHTREEHTREEHTREELHTRGVHHARHWIEPMPEAMPGVPSIKSISWIPTSHRCAEGEDDAYACHAQRRRGPRRSDEIEMHASSMSHRCTHYYSCSRPIHLESASASHGAW